MANFRQTIDMILNATTKGTDRMRDEIEKIGHETKVTNQQAGIGSLKWTELNNAFQLVTGSIRMVTGGLQQAYGVLKETAALEQAEQQFNNLTASIGSTSDSMMNELRAATMGMASDAELMASASQIISLGLASTQEETAELANAIATLGLDMQQVILTFSNNSKARLDSLSLSVEDVTNRTKELEDQGFKGDAFDRAVMDALIQKMELLGDASETTAGQLKTAEASFKNTVNALKEMALQSFLAADGVEQLNLMASTAEYNATAKQLENYGYHMQVINKQIGQVENRFDLFRTKEEKMQEQLMAQEGTERARIALLLLEQGFEGSSLALAEAVDQYQAAATHEEAAAARAKEMTEYYSQFAEAVDEVTETQIRQSDATADLSDKYAQAGNQLTEYESYLVRKEAADEEAAAAAEDHAAALLDQEAAAAAAADAQDRLTRRIGEYFDEALTGEEQTESLSMQLYNAAAAADADAYSLAILAAATGEFTAAEIEAAFQTALLQENINYLAEAVASGATSATMATDALFLLQSGEATTAQEALNLQANINHAANALDDAAGKAYALGDAIESLPTQRTFTYTLKTDTSGFSLPPGVSAGDVTVKAGGIGLASGTAGWQTVPPGYPNDSYGPLYLSSGERFNVTPAGGGGAAAGGSVVIGDIHVHGMNDAGAAADEIITLIDQHYSGV